MERFGKPPERGQIYRDRPGAYAIITGARGMLVTEQRSAYVPEPEIQLPGGGIDPGENPAQALHREALEETGWRVADLCRLTAYQRYVYMPEYDLWARKICHIYTARATLCHGAPREAGHRALWLSPREAVPQLVSEGDRAVATRLFNLVRGNP